MSKLYELTGQYLALSQMADDPDLPEQALQDTLEGLQGDIEAKAGSLMKVVAGMDSNTNALDDEIKRLQARKSAIANRAESLREYLRFNMQNAGISKIQSPLFSITLSSPQPIVLIDNEKEIPAAYVKTVTVSTPIKKDILEALKKGSEVPGCSLGEAKQRLTIR